MYKHTGKVVIKILQGSVVIQTALGGLAIYLPVANFLQCTCAKNYAPSLAVDKVIAKTTRQLSYRKENRAMRPIYGCPEKF